MRNVLPAGLEAVAKKADTLHVVVNTRQADHGSANARALEKALRGLGGSSLPIRRGKRNPTLVDVWAAALPGKEKAPEGASKNR
jgi:hypothetical protein